MARRSPCVYDAGSDQRRKIANQRNVQQLADTHVQLERTKQLLGGIIATIRAGDFNANDDLIRNIRSGVGLSQLAAHVRNECRSNVAIQNAYEQINLMIDGPLELPSPSQLLAGMPSQGDNSFESKSNGDASGNVYAMETAQNQRRTRS
jgi:hypothetical protein